MLHYLSVDDILNRANIQIRRKGVRRKGHLLSSDRTRSDPIRTDLKIPYHVLILGLSWIILGHWRVTGSRGFRELVSRVPD